MKKAKKSKLTLDELKKKSGVNNETIESVSGGVLGMGSGATSANGQSYDGDLKPPRGTKS